MFSRNGKSSVRREKELIYLGFLFRYLSLPYLGIAFPTLYVNDQYLTGLKW